ncbi:MaoC/PaaZ C-terminal domain-containing protein [Crossiella sp. CA-258035]|uniref:MaoC/PaaZ C-terminal domain-containing protein n=1 Tax=Crossiella sp. CA-258035 TaxID=2981138 RepID=UPI0024BCFAC8|nr:MaoC/PaaZ C-terminal domain-containing protein [Crossiella sp. CA-258035]WHT20344.1 MaoC/PaaZ C-terminal domain-containing protein [Crossiella sp. CA-258035]
MVAIAYEDLTPGRIIPLGQIVIDKDEMLAFAERFDPQPFHLDEAAGAASVLGGLCASGWYTGSLWMRSYVDHVLTGSTSQGSPGLTELSWSKPVFPGDVLRSELEVVSARRSASREGLGLVQMIGRLFRDEDLVMRAAFTGMFGTRS